MRGVEAIAAAVLRQREGWSGPILERQTVSASDPRGIGEVVADFCRELTVDVDECLFFHSSQSSVFGLVLSDGRQLGLKAHDDRFSLRFLQQIQCVQWRLVAAGFACPAPTGEPIPFASGFAPMEELLLGGEFADAHRPEIRRAMAVALAELGRLGGEMDPQLPRVRLMDRRPDRYTRRPTTRSLISNGRPRAPNGSTNGPAWPYRSWSPNTGSWSWGTAIGRRRTSASWATRSPPSSTGRAWWSIESRALSGPLPRTSP
jgi:hypothetical protein